MSESEHEKPEVGLVPDEDLPEDLRPTDDNPLAKNPGDEPDSGSDSGSDSGTDAGPGGSPDDVTGTPDVTDPGSPA